MVTRKIVVVLRKIPNLICCLGVAACIFINVLILSNLYPQARLIPHARHVFESAAHLKAAGGNLSVLTDLSPRSNSIFFLETSGATVLGAKQCCAIESVARHHPHHDIYVVMTSPVIELTSGRLSCLKKKFSNLHFKYLDINDFVEETPLEQLWKTGVISSSQYFVSHLSDVLRFLILQRFGGTYLDSDIIALRPLPDLLNFVGRESWTHPFVAAGVMRFQRGHPILEEFVRDLAKNFDGNEWGANGPKLVTRVLQQFCRTQNLSLMTPEKCQGITVFQPEAFYPIPWRQWREYFDDKISVDVLKKVKHSFTAHVWGKHSSSTPFIGKKSQQPYSLLAKQHCPVIYGTL